MNPLGKGRRKQIRGKVRERIGKVRGNKVQQVSGRIERMEGEARLGRARVTKKVRKRL